jgi:protein phosphatase
MDAAGLWHELDTDWVCLDCELMPWSAKAQELIRLQYAAVGSASQAALGEAVTALEAAHAGRDVAEPLARMRTRHDLATRYVAPIAGTAGPSRPLDDYRLAPFHLMASEGAVHVDKDHLWHLETLGRLCAAPRRFCFRHGAPGGHPVRPREPGGGRGLVGVAHGSGGEGMVVKPIDFVSEGLDAGSCSRR